MNRADLKKVLSPPPVWGPLGATAVISTAWHAVVGDPWMHLPIRLAFSCALTALICWVWQRLAKRWGSTS